jgi:ATP-dependent helicase/nuclease subunit A
LAQNYEFPVIVDIKPYIYNMSPLNVYKASAGSGKTFALTLAYLELLFRFPEKYRNILAVTFTNKAAGEMKGRILDRLHRLSRQDDPEVSEERGQLIRKTGLAAGEIRQRAGYLLDTILNDYSGFSVGTIDKFFQSVIRSFTREIGVQPGYNLELDHQRVLVLAVDQLFSDIAVHDELQQWLIRYAEERLEESRSWNFRDDIVNLGMQLFKESFQELFTEADLSVLGKENMERYLGDLRRAEEAARREMSRTGITAMEHLRKEGLGIEDFKLKGNSPPSLFRQAAETGEVRFTDAKLEALSQSGKWLNKDAAPGVVSITENVLMPLLNRLYSQQVVLNSVQAIRQNFYTLGILGDIRERVQAYLKEHNLFLIADSSRFLRGIIGGNQVPFIYERTGNRYSHIMLDEFQDTSVFQYGNFKPLLENALAAGNENLVVGDVKQSIYRWRNSDWNILASELEDDFRHQEVHVHALDKNFRSREQVIRFNNTLFQLAPEYLARVIETELLDASVDRSGAEAAVGHFRRAYSDAVQKIPDRSEGSGGMVKISFFPDPAERPFREQVLERIPQWIDEIQQSGIQPGEIAILVRSRREGIMVAEKLLEHARITGETQRFRLVSSESLLLPRNGSVSLLVSALQFLVQPEDELNNALLKYRCYQAGVIAKEGTDRLFDSSLPPVQFLPSEFLERIDDYRQMPLFELTESLITLFRLDQQIHDLPYLQAFQDLVVEVQRREPIGITDFLQYWEQHGYRKGIQVSENSNAIRILTIHRSKGLEFRAVLVPFSNWEITTDHRKGNIIWCSTRGTPFSRLPSVPVGFRSSLKHTCFSAAYYQERMKGYMDNLNLMYVAFTRAVDVMYLGVPERDGKDLKNTGDLLCSILEMRPGKGPALETLARHRSGNLIVIGQMPVIEAGRGDEDQWHFSSYPSNPGKRPLKIRMRSDEYFVDEEGMFKTEQLFGNIMHLVFSQISTSRDVDPVLDALEKEGVLPRKDRGALQERIMEMITQPQVEEWFSETGRTIHSERSILCGSGKVLRPDRVIVSGQEVTVVDFKFGHIEKEHYRAQVLSYMEQLSEMGYTSVKGYIWYVLPGKIIQIQQP